MPRLVDRFERVRTLSRIAHHRTDGVETRVWDGADPGPAALDEVDTVIHLAGEPIFGGPLTRARMSRIRASRVDSTRGIVARLLEAEARDRPRTLVCASAVGFYGDAGEKELPETAPSGEGFLAEVCRAWEHEAVRAEEGGVRVIRLRIGVVLSRESGALALMRWPFALGVGGRLGSGRQFFPWIHAPDLAEVISFCVDSELSGPVNAVAPELVRNADLTRELAQAGDPRANQVRAPAYILAIRMRARLK